MLPWSLMSLDVVSSLQYRGSCRLQRFQLAASSIRLDTPAGPIYFPLCLSCVNVWRAAARVMIPEGAARHQAIARWKVRGRNGMAEHYLVFLIDNTSEVVKIVTSYLQTPNAVRDLDWFAYSENWQTGDPIGHGPTEQEAIQDLREELENRVHFAITREVDEED